MIKNESLLLQNHFRNLNKDEELASIWMESLDNIYFNNISKTYEHSREVGESLKFDYLSNLFEEKKKLFQKDEINCKKLYDKSNVIINGYIKSSQILCQQFDELIENIHEFKNLIIVYKNLVEQDKLSIEKRKLNLQSNVLKIMDKERNLQAVFKKYNDKISELEKL